jgi:hypothetical protein
MYWQTSIPTGSYLRSLAGAAALGILLTSAGPAAANLGPRGAVPDAQHGGRPAYGGGRDYPHYGYGYSCLYYGYATNCPYYELPNWNGGTEVRNPGG